MKTEERQIPTHLDLLRHVSGSMIRGEYYAATADIAQLLTEPTFLVDQPFNFIAYARCCHAAAQVKRAEGDERAAEFLHDLGQFLLERAVSAYSELLAAIVVPSETH
ncbi:MAG: hypothetical protein ABS35_15460 [Kaistia sp. SCN 65-12]|mgnify:CR=1 FL=1|nr:MAG: hypothetical protein ABS35_15460 [Kaistia sp. SCN 65-12]